MASGVAMKTSLLHRDIATILIARRVVYHTDTIKFACSGQTVIRLTSGTRPWFYLQKIRTAIELCTRCTGGDT